MDHIAEHLLNEQREKVVNKSYDELVPIVFDVLEELFRDMQYERAKEIASDIITHTAGENHD
jgi:hypothetical protein